jgi:hypothetical protein
MQVSPVVKFLIGLLAVLLMGWVSHGPLGAGERLLSSLEARASAEIDKSQVAGVEVRMKRDPMARVATLSGPANDFQREGMGQFPGINDRIRAVEGIDRIEWNQPTGAAHPERFLMPLLAETLIALVLAYLVGVGVAWLLFGREKKDTYL